MNFNEHSVLRDKHAFLSPSNYHWINYTDQKLDARWASARAAARGTALHDYARQAIFLGIRQARIQQTLNQYINDAIGYQMNVEQPLFYSPNCFGTADTISFKKGLLRVHDLKTGISPTSHSQLEVYVAIFCLEYSVSPFDIGMELRIYQNNEIKVHIPDPEKILFIMDKIIRYDQRIEELKEGDL